MILIKVVSAQLTRDTELFSNMDPYCSLRLGGQTQRTQTKNQAGKKPVWNQSFRFTSPQNNLKVIVMDEDNVSDDTIGEGTVNISKFRTMATEQQEIVQLYYNGKTAGKVLLRISNGGGNQTPSNPYQQPNVWGNQQQQQNNQWGNNQQWGNQPQNNQWGGNQPPQNNQWGNNVPPQNNQWGNQPQNKQWGNQQPPQNNQWGNQPPQNNQWGGNQPPQNNQWGNNPPPQNNSNGWNQQQGSQWGNNQVNPNKPPGNNQWGQQSQGGNQWGNNNQIPMGIVNLINPNNPVNPPNPNQGNLYPDLQYKPPTNNNNVPPNNNQGYNNGSNNNMNVPFQLIGGMQGLFQPNNNSQQGNPYSR